MCSELTILPVISKLKTFSPIKVIYNDTCVLYNDYDDIAGIGEDWPIEYVLKERMDKFNISVNTIITKVELEIVSYHHSVVKLYSIVQEEDKVES